MKKIAVITSILLALFVMVALYQGNHLILGGEGNYFLNPHAVQHLYRNTWFPLGRGIGGPNALVHQTYILFDIFSFFQNLHVPYKIINLALVYSLYAFPFLAMYFLTYIVIKTSFKNAVLVSLFYVCNPFFVMQANFMMMWNIAPFVVLPIAFAIIYYFYYKPIPLFTIFGLFVAVSAFSFENIPYLGIFHVFLPIAIVICSYLYTASFNLKQIVKNYVLCLISFILFSAWWLFPLVRLQYQEMGTMSLNFTKSASVEYVTQAAMGTGLTMNKIFTLKTLVSNEPEYFFDVFYNNPLVHIAMLIPLFIILYGLLIHKYRYRIPLTITAFFLMIIFFLNKGVNEPLSWIYILFIEKIPFFLIFKTPLEKFSTLTSFLFALALLFTLKKSRMLLILTSLYLLVCAIPYVSGQFLADYKIDRNKFISRQFDIKKEYSWLVSTINADTEDYRVMSLPGSLNYQVTMHSFENKYYRGFDPLMFALNKPFIAIYLGPHFEPLYTHLSDKNIDKALALFTVKKVVLNNDIIPAFGFREKESPQQINTILTKKMTKQTNGAITIFTNPIFYPHIYVPSYSIKAPHVGDNLTRLIAKHPHETNKPFALFDMSDTARKQILDAIPTSISTAPFVTFTKHNESFYTVSITTSENKFPLIFSETFNKGWELSGVTDHIMANTFANAWLIDTNSLCKAITCKTNSNGTRTMQLTLQFWPEKLFTGGRLASLITAFIGLSVLCLSLFRKKRLTPNGTNVINKSEEMDALIYGDTHDDPMHSFDKELRTYVNNLIHKASSKRIILLILILFVYFLSLSTISRQVLLVLQILLWLYILYAIQFFDLLSAAIKKMIVQSRMSRETLFKRLVIMGMWFVGVVVFRRLGLGKDYIDAGTQLFLVYLPVIWLLKVTEPVNIIFTFALVFLIPFLVINNFVISAEIIAICIYYIIVIIVSKSLFTNKKEEI